MKIHESSVENEIFTLYLRKYDSGTFLDDTSDGLKPLWNNQ